ncbi:hypothetical protein F5Y15DRAFT_430332 [Xylariaceae sp. FL0016]|nr:hypothetical protein F5Y15DRAFT_430332 [Xylariaceae sp. FL0016]
MHSYKIFVQLLSLGMGLMAVAQNTTDDDTGPVPGDDGPGATITSNSSSISFTDEIARSPGNAIVVNNCAKPMYLWSVDADKTSAVHKLAANGGRFSEQMHAPSSGGVSMKVHGDKNGGVVPACDPHRYSCKLTQFEYTLAKAQGKVYYDISFVNCAHGKNAGNCPGHAGGVKVHCTNGKCPVRKCDAGAFCPHEVYYHCGDPCNTPDPTKATKLSRNLVFTLCSGGGSSKREVDNDFMVDVE